MELKKSLQKKWPPLNSIRTSSYEMADYTPKRVPFFLQVDLDSTGDLAIG